jgi:hypothetical protein
MFLVELLVNSGLPVVVVGLLVHIHQHHRQELVELVLVVQVLMLVAVMLEITLRD